jgi:hypothetical protein
LNYIINKENIYVNNESLVIRLIKNVWSRIIKSHYGSRNCRPLRELKSVKRGNCFLLLYIVYDLTHVVKTHQKLRDYRARIYFGKKDQLSTNFHLIRKPCGKHLTSDLKKNSFMVTIMLHNSCDTVTVCQSFHCD